MTGDAAADERALAEDFLGVYPDGFDDRQAHAGQLSAGARVVRFWLSEARALPIDTEHGLLAYRADFLRHGAGDESAMYVSSLWAWRGERWINVFSQDTPREQERLP